MPASPISLAVADGTHMSAYVSTPADGQHNGAAVIVIQEIFGVNAHIRSVTDRFADAGYLALSPDLFHRPAPGFEGEYTDLEGGRKHAYSLTPEGVAADLQAAWSWLAEHVRDQRIAMVGFCMGGALSVVGNVLLPLRCAVSYYGSPAYIGRFVGDDFAPRLHGPQLFFWGGLDHFINLEARTALTEQVRAAGKPFVSMELSFADHGFHCDARASYHPEAATLAWQTTLGFFAQHLG